MFSEVKMRIFIVVLVLYVTSATGKSTKKSKDESAILTKKLIGKSKPLPPAIIAIEIVDPNENKTSKNSKRTINSSLGYGYQSPPKYEVYKYSQHDIPPYRGPPNIFHGGPKSHHYDIQKSVSYKLPSQTHKSPNLNKYYQPGTTLYSSVNSQGQVGSLSSHLPQQQYSNEPHVPVIILKVYPSQLSDPSGSLHANLPQSHPLADAINSIDIQSLLAKYVQNLLLDQQQHYQPAPQLHYQPPQQHYQPQYQQDYHYQYVMPPQHYHQEDTLLTHENYPKETHTRVIFRTDKNKLGISPEHTETKTIQISLPAAHSYSAVQVETPEMQYAYANQEDGSQGYYYQQGDVSQNYYYQMVPAEYQQAEQPVQNEAPHNYHAHQKRSKKVRFSRRLQQTPEDVIRLDPIKA